MVNAGEFSRTGKGAVLHLATYKCIMGFFKEAVMRLLVLSLLCLAACGPSAAVQTGQSGGEAASGGNPPSSTQAQDVSPSGQAGEAGSAGNLLPRGGEQGERGRILSTSGALTLMVETAAGPMEVRLAEIDTPVPDLTQAWLADHVVGREIELVYSGLRRDRYERALAHVLMPDANVGEEPAQDAAWLQYRLIDAGLARVMSHADNQAQAALLLPVEAGARQGGRGLWADPAHQVRDPHPDARAQDVGSAQIVEGRVLDAVQLNSGRIYLNFGSDYRTDFTVRIDAADSQAFLDAGLTPAVLSGQRIRVRGWVTDENGPMIALDHPARLELLGEDASAARAR
jgi:micrococcal nuclease